MAKPTIDLDSCSACGTCVDSCPNGCLDLEDTAVLARADDCSECGTCVDSCPNGAISA
jgi:NAD-dependent dihydropyrimidine dehydrogenase PreA subunit